MSTTFLAPESAIAKKKSNSRATGRKKGSRAKRACFHCKKAKTSCSNERPCSRCVRLGLTDSCIDTPRSDITEEGKFFLKKKGFVDKQLKQNRKKTLGNNSPIFNKEKQ